MCNNCADFVNILRSKIFNFTFLKSEKLTELAKQFCQFFTHIFAKSSKLRINFQSEIILLGKNVDHLNKNCVILPTFKILQIRRSNSAILVSTNFQISKFPQFFHIRLTNLQKNRHNLLSSTLPLSSPVSPHVSHSSRGST